MTTRTPKQRSEQSQAERSEASRRALIGATMKVLANEGYGAASLARISEVAGLSRGLANYYFGTKRKLMETVIRRIRDTYAETLPVASSDLSGYEAIAKLFETYLEGLAAHEGRRYTASRVMFVLSAESVTNAPEIHDAIGDAYGVFRHHLEEYLARGMEDGSIRADVPIVPYAVALHGLLRGLVLQHFVSDSEDDLASANTAIHELLQTLRPPQSD